MVVRFADTLSVRSSSPQRSSTESSEYAAPPRHSPYQRRESPTSPVYRIPSSALPPPPPPPTRPLPIPSSFPFEPSPHALPRPPSRERGPMRSPQEYSRSPQTLLLPASPMPTAYSGASPIASGLSPSQRPAFYGAYAPPPPMSSGKPSPAPLNPRMNTVERIGNSFYFLISMRTAALILTLCAVFSCAFSARWMEKTPAVFAMVFTIISGLIMAAAIAVLFMWDLAAMTLPKRALFVLLFCLTSLTAGILFVVAISVCSSYNAFGCFETNQSPALRAAAAFSFIVVIFGVVDVVLQFYFYRTDPKARIDRYRVATINPPQSLSSRHTEV